MDDFLSQATLQQCNMLRVCRYIGLGDGGLFRPRNVIIVDFLLFIIKKTYDSNFA
jgi:hypothetical protein